MSVVVLDANAVIAHGRAFPGRVRAAFERGDRLILPQSVKRELVDDVLENEDAPENHRQSAKAIQELVDEGYLRVREPDYRAYGDVIDEARRRIADESLPEHAVKADQYVPAIVCELCHEGPVTLVTADRKLAETVHTLAAKRGVADELSIRKPAEVLRTD